jgi:hypothetical protein
MGWNYSGRQRGCRCAGIRAVAVTVRAVNIDRPALGCRGRIRDYERSRIHCCNASLHVHRATLKERPSVSCTEILHGLNSGRCLAAKDVSFPRDVGQILFRARPEERCHQQMPSAACRCARQRCANVLARLRSPTQWRRAKARPGVRLFSRGANSIKECCRKQAESRVSGRWRIWANFSAFVMPHCYAFNLDFVSLSESRLRRG